MGRECGPVTEVIEPDEYGGVKIVFGQRSCVRLTCAHWESIQNWVKQNHPDEPVPAVASLYVDSFKEDELMSLPEKLREWAKEHGIW